MPLIEIGKIVRYHGLAGRMKALSYLESTELLSGRSDLYVGRIAEDAILRTLESVETGKNSFIVKFQGIDDRNSAAALIGCSVWVASDTMKTLPEGEYYWRDIIGLQVLTEEDEILGRIEAVFPTGSNDVYVCRGGKREILLPAINDVVRKIDIDRGVIVVRLLKGLSEP